MNQYNKFLNFRRKQLLSHLRPGLMHPVTPAAALEFVDEVLQDWHAQFGGKKLGPPTLVERAFWYTLYLYEDVSEALQFGAGQDPWVVQQQANLQRLYDMLKKRSRLAPGMWATRPDGDAQEYEGELTLEEWLPGSQLRV